MAMNAGTAYVEVLPSMNNFATGVGKGINKIGNQITRTSRVLTRGITIPVALAGAAAVKMALDYETSIQRVGALTEASRGQVKQWSDQILETAPKLAVAPNDFAQALYFVASSGAKVAQVMPITTASVKLAAAGMGDASTVAQILTSAVNAYGAANLSAADAADQLTEAIKVGKAEPAALATALGRVIPQSQAMGVSFAETAASVSTLTNTGLSAAEATTALRSVLTTLIKPAAQTKEEYKKLGFTVEGLRKSIADHGLNETLMMMKRAIGDNQDALGKLFPNQRAIIGFLSLTGKNAAQVARNVDLVTKSTGAANKAFKRASESDAFKFRKALAGLQAEAVKLGTALLPIAKQVIENIVGIVEAFKGLSPGVQRAVIEFIALLAILGPIGTLLGNMIIIFSAVVRVSALLGTGLLTLAAGFGRATASAQLYTVSMEEAQAATTPVIGALSLVAAGLSVIVGIAFLAYITSLTDPTTSFADAERDAASATQELSDALLGLKTGQLDLKQATLDRRRAVVQLAKDERAQAAFVKKNGHENHALADQIEQDSIDIARAKGRQGIAEQDIADSQEKIRAAVKKSLGAQQEAYKIAQKQALLNERKLNPSFLRGANAQTRLREKTVLSVEAARLFVHEMANQNTKLISSGKNLKGATLRTAELNQAAQDLTIKLGHVPTTKQINVYFKNNMDKLRQEVADLRAQLDALHDKNISITVTRRIEQHKAAGGPVSANTPYLVGERGPELFVPHGGGTIVPNNRLRGSGASGGKVRLVIDNWEEGTGYMEDIADGSVGRNSGLNRQKRRMNR